MSLQYHGLRRKRSPIDQSYSYTRHYGTRIFTIYYEKCLFVGAEAQGQDTSAPVVEEMPRMEADETPSSTTTAPTTAAQPASQQQQQQEQTSPTETTTSSGAVPATTTAATTSAAASAAAAPATLEQRTNARFPTQAEREAARRFLIDFVGATCIIFSIEAPEERRVAIETLRMAEHVRASLELEASPVPITLYPHYYVLLDGHVCELPVGIDPSFLGALPDSLRREVIMEQLRIQGIDIRNRPIPASAQLSTSAAAAPAATTAAAAAAAAAATPATTANTQSMAITAEIDPDFIAALPPNIQAELLTQQRIEQQAAGATAAAAAAQPQSAATAAGGEVVPAGSGAAGAASAADDDHTAFLRALPSALRQAILFDMDHSQIGALPEDLANEARALQQQQREREIDLLTAAAAHRNAAGSRGAGGGGAGGGISIPHMGTSGRYSIATGHRGLSSIYNAASSLLNDTYLYGTGAGGGGSGVALHGRDLNRLRRNLRHLNDTDLIFSAGQLTGFDLTTIPGGAGGHQRLYAAGGPTSSSSAAAAAAVAAAAALDKTRSGRQLLDHESLACLLVLLFIEDARLNMTKLHRVVRNLCIHGATRAWVIKALLCILDKVSGKSSSTVTAGGATTSADNNNMMMLSSPQTVRNIFSFHSILFCSFLFNILHWICCSRWWFRSPRG